MCLIHVFRYEADYNWSQKGRILLDPPVDRVEVKL